MAATARAQSRRAPGRMACVDLPVFGLQLLLREKPEWRRHPCGVVAEDRPDAPLVALNHLAERAGLRVGMRYGAARHLVPALRAAPMPDHRIAETMADLARSLGTFSPRVEPDARRPGTFYLDPSGLDRIYGGLRSWADAVHAYLRGRGLRGSVAIAFERFEAFAVARARRGVTVVADPATAAEILSAVPLARLDVSSDLLAELALLDVRTVGDLAALPADALHARYGREASALHALACGPQLPLQARPERDPVRVTAEIDPPDADHARLLFAIKGALHELVREVAGRAETVRAIEVELRLETRPSTLHRERIEPASSTRDALVLLDLIRLRLADRTFEAPVEAIAVTAETAAPSGQQLTLFRFGSRRDLRAGDRALARVRAAFGPRSVSKARLRDAHLPEAGFSWDAVDAMPKATSAECDAPDMPPLVRRVLPRPKPLPAGDGAHPEKGPRLGDGDRALLRLYGPYRVSGGWWVRTVERDYYYGENVRGDLLWLYYDRPRQRWFLHGAVD